MKAIQKIQFLFFSLLVAGCMSGESVSLAPGQQGNSTVVSLNSSPAQTPTQAGSALGGEGNSATGSGTGAGPGGQPTEEVNIKPKRTNIRGEVCLVRDGQADCESELSGALTFLAWEGDVNEDLSPENPPLVVAADGSFTHPTGFNQIEGECQTAVRYEASYTEGNQTYSGELEMPSCPSVNPRPVRVLLLLPGKHHIPDVLDGWVKR